MYSNCGYYKLENHEDAASLKIPFPSHKSALVSENLGLSRCYTIYFTCWTSRVGLSHPYTMGTGVFKILTQHRPCLRHVLMTSDEDSAPPRREGFSMHRSQSEDWTLVT